MPSLKPRGIVRIVEPVSSLGSHQPHSPPISAPCTIGNLGFYWEENYSMSHECPTWTKWWFQAALAINWFRPNDLGAWSWLGMISNAARRVWRNLGEHRWSSCLRHPVFDLSPKVSLESGIIMAFPKSTHFKSTGLTRFSNLLRGQAHRKTLSHFNSHSNSLTKIRVRRVARLRVSG
jgi:hypothetical protein